MAGNVTIGTGANGQHPRPRQPGGGARDQVAELVTLLGASPALGLVNNCPARNATDLTVERRHGEQLRHRRCTRRRARTTGSTSTSPARAASGSSTSPPRPRSPAGTPFPPGDGLDTLWNVDNLRFCQATDAVTEAVHQYRDVVIPNAPTLTSVTAGERLGFGSGQLHRRAGQRCDRAPLPGRTHCGPMAPSRRHRFVAAAGALSVTVTGLTNGTAYTFRVTALTAGVLETTVTSDPAVESPPSNVSAPVTPAAPPAPAVAVLHSGNGSTGFSETGNIVVTFNQPILASSIAAQHRRAEHHRQPRRSTARRRCRPTARR